jgi:hypothetical protein
MAIAHPVVVFFLCPMMVPARGMAFHRQTSLVAYKSSRVRTINTTPAERSGAYRARPTAAAFPIIMAGRLPHDSFSVHQTHGTLSGQGGKPAGPPLVEMDTQRRLKTVEELCQGHVENRAKKKKKKWKEDESCLDRDVLPKLKSRLAVSVVSADIEAVHSEVGSVHPYSANRILEVVRETFDLRI